MVLAYVLIRTTAYPVDVASELRMIDGVKTSLSLFGPTDLIALIEAEDLRGIEKIVGKIHGVKGVGSTDTRIVIEK